WPVCDRDPGRGLGDGERPDAEQAGSGAHFQERRRATGELGQHAVVGGGRNMEFPAVRQSLAHGDTGLGEAGLRSGLRRAVAWRWTGTGTAKLLLWFLLGRLAFEEALLPAAIRLTSERQVAVHWC